MSAISIGLLTSIPVTIEAFFLDWIEKWNADGFRVATAAGPGKAATALTNHTEIDGLSQRPGFSTLRALGQFRNWAKREKLSIVVTSTATASAVARLAGRPSEAPWKTVYFCHGLHFESNRAPFAMVERLLARGTDAFICMNEADRKWIGSVSQKPLIKLQHGVGLCVESWTDLSRKPPSNEALRVAWVGSPQQRKRPLDAVAIAGLLHEMGRDVELIMAGIDASYAGLTDAIRTAGLMGRVHPVGRTDVKVLLAEVDVVLHTAEWEGYCRSLLEAVAAGVPAVSYPVKGCIDNPWVVCSEAESPDALARLLAGTAWQQPQDVDLDAISWQEAHRVVTDMILSL